VAYSATPAQRCAGVFHFGSFFYLSMIFSENRGPLFGIMLYASMQTTPSTPSKFWRSSRHGMRRRVLPFRMLFENVMPEMPVVDF